MLDVEASAFVSEYRCNDVTLLTIRVLLSRLFQPPPVKFVPVVEIVQIQFRIVRADGSVRWLHLVRMVIFRENNVHDAVRVLGFVAEIDRPTGHLRPWLHGDIAA